VSVLGSRPEIIQAASLSTALREHVEELLIHTGQHYDDELSLEQIVDTRLPLPDRNLGVGSRSDVDQLAVGEARVAEVLDAESPDGMLVRGDTNATLSGARAAASRDLPLFHVEAGLRAFRTDMPEERNREEADRLADVLFAPTGTAVANLEAESVAGEIVLSGDVLRDMFEAWRPHVPSGRAWPGEYVLATVHRNFNTDFPERLQSVLDCLGRAPWPVLFPIHPRTSERIEAWRLRVPANVHPVRPVPYTRMLALERDARAIATDSGGVVRESYLWGVPCVTLREETEWVETVETGWNVATGVDEEWFAAAIQRPAPSERPPIFGDGRAAPRIAGLVADYLTSQRERTAAA
jgi:UDP-N-acetylglucosamine 2-epimerase